MKRSIVSLLFCGCFALGVQSFAQSTKASPVAPGAAIPANAVTYSLPQTVLTIEITVEQEIIKRGPYARYAQQYLGAVAPLSDKEFYTILGARLGYTAESDPSAVYVLDSPQKTPFDLYYQTPGGPVANDGISKNHLLPTDSGTDLFLPDNDFDGLQIDKTNMSTPSLEEAAAEAARTLFTLRKRRFDLVTGEAGEQVYGEGMQAALNEMKRLEDEYTALFLGKRTVRRITKTFTVIPEAGKNRAIVCRFSDDGGLLPDSDLSGRPIVLELTPENKVGHSIANPASGRDSRGTVFMRIADMVRCQLTDDKTVLFNERIPVYQFGHTVEAPVTSSK